MRTIKESKYRKLDYILPTSNIVERLFSRAKIIMADRRKSMTPYHLELLLFLRMNKDLWSAGDIQDIIDVGAQDEAPAPNEGVIEEVIAVAEGEDAGMVVVE